MKNISPSNIITLLLWIVMITLSLIVIVDMDDKINSLEGRVELLKSQMHDKLRPIVASNIQHATIFNSDGEIVIETEGEDYVGKE